MLNRRLWSNAWTGAIGIELPIVQAPMAGATTADLVAAVSNAGALGSYAAAYAQPDDIVAAIAAIRRATDRPFAVNVFALGSDAALGARGLPANASAVLEVVAKLHAELGLDPPSIPASPAVVLEEQLAVIAEARVPIVSFTFGVLPQPVVAALKARGVHLIGTATTVDEALILERDGIDAVVAQGSEAGGHRGSFATRAPGGMIGTLALVPQIASAVRIPVIAAGGIMDGRGIVAARVLGASAAQLGTAFLACSESGIPDGAKEALLRATENDTIVTDVVTGRHGRGLRNHLTETFEHARVAPLPFGWQTAILAKLRRAAVEQKRVDLLPLFAGQGLRLLRRQSAAALIADLVADAAGKMNAVV